MIFYLLNSNFEKVDVIDSYESALWTDRYLEPGDFEFYIRIGEEIPSGIKLGRYVVHKDSEHVMIIEQLKIETDIEDGNVLIVTGRSAESLLDRRIVYNEEEYDEDTLYVTIHNLIINNVTEPASQYRKFLTQWTDPVTEQVVDRSVFEFDEAESAPISRLTDLRVNKIYYGENLLDIVNDLCGDFEIGFKVILKEDPNFEYYQIENPKPGSDPKSLNWFEYKESTKEYIRSNDTGVVSGKTYYAGYHYEKFFFILYKGRDFTDTTKKNYVAFTDKFGNLLNSNYLRNEKPHKNVALCLGPEEDKWEEVNVQKILQGQPHISPQEEGWYWHDEYDNEYNKTSDESPQSGKKYYIRNGKIRKRQVATSGNLSKRRYLNRKEEFVDCSGVSKKKDNDGGYEIVYPKGNENPSEEKWYVYFREWDEYVETEDTYVKDNKAYYDKVGGNVSEEVFAERLLEKGREKLKETVLEKKFEAEVDPVGAFKYGKNKDYRLGDLVVIRDEYGNQGIARVTEYTYVDNVSDGTRYYPTFKMEED